MIVVATEDFELYHDVVAELRERGVAFTTVRPDEELPEGTDVVVSAPADHLSVEDPDVEHVVADRGARQAVGEALSVLRGGDGRTVVGVDPGDRPGIAVLSDETVVAAFRVPLADAVDVVRREVSGEPDAVVRVGDGARLAGSRIVNELEGATVELVDETGTTPYLGEGARGMGDVLAAVNIARREGEPVETREVEPTAGELQRIKNRSRKMSEGGRTIPRRLARRVATGELTVEEAQAEHRAESESESESESEREREDGPE